MQKLLNNLGNKQTSKCDGKVKNQPVIEFYRRVCKKFLKEKRTNSLKE